MVQNENHAFPPSNHKAFLYERIYVSMCGLVYGVWFFNFKETFVLVDW